MEGVRGRIDRKEVEKVFRSEVREKSLAASGVRYKTGKRGFVGNLRFAKDPEGHRASKTETYNIDKMVEMLQSSNIIKEMFMERLEKQYNNYQKVISDSFDGIVELVSVALGVMAEDLHNVKQEMINAFREETRAMYRETNQLLLAIKDVVPTSQPFRSILTDPASQDASDQLGESFWKTAEIDPTGMVNSAVQGNKDAEELVAKVKENIEQPKEMSVLASLQVSETKEELESIEEMSAAEPVNEPTKEMLDEKLADLEYKIRHRVPLTTMQRKLYFFLKAERNIEAAGRRMTYVNIRDYIPRIYAYLSGPKRFWSGTEQFKAEFEDFKNRRGEWEGINLMEL